MLSEAKKQVLKQWLPIALAIAATVCALPPETRWMPIASAVIWSVIRIFKKDTSVPGVIPARWRPVVVAVLASAASVVDQVIAGGDWRKLVSHAAAVCAGASAVHIFGVDVLGSGKDLPLPKALSHYPPPPPGPHLTSMPPIPPSAGIPVIDEDGIPTKPELDKMGTLAARRGIAMTLAAASLTLVMSGCGASTAENTRTAAQYESELVACVETAKTLAESRACRCETNKRWQRQCVDDVGGTP